MRVIDLLNKIANSEEIPKKIKYKDFEYLWHDKPYGYCRPAYDCTYICFFTDFTIYEILDDEVEIIEEDKKIEKLDIHQEKNCKNNWKWKCNGYNISTPQKIIGEKLNEVIDKLNEMEENK